MRILVIDDDFTCRVQSKALMSEFGDCDGASNGRTGLDLFKLAHGESHAYDVIVLDVDMPDMSGLDVLKELREWEEQKGHVKEGTAVNVIMLSALSDGRTVMTSFGAGCEVYLVKPLSRAKIQQALDEVGLARTS
jgi:two-component system, chemotaxis family, chemotaxis protein CheY